MNFSLVLMVTLGCNSRCSHCCLACEPSKLNLRLTKDSMTAYIKEANRVGAHSVVFLGGEPTVMIDDLYEPMILARTLGMYVDLRTNAHWASSSKRARNVLRQLQLCGLQRLGLSHDHYHMERVNGKHIENAIEAAKELDIDFYLDWIGLEDEQEVADYLGICSPQLRTVYPPLRVGRATKLDDACFAAIPVEELEQNPVYSMRCGANGDEPLLTIFPNGYASFHQCCWVNPRLIHKVGGKDWIGNLVDKASCDEAISFLRNEGIGGLIEKARGKQPALLKSYYSHQCEVCYDLLGQLFPNGEELPWYLQEFHGTS